MKRTDYKAYLGRAFMTLAFMGAMSACVEEDLITNGFKKATGEELSIMPIISDGTVVTRAEAIEALKEKDLVTLDVFVEHITGTTGDGTFLRQYHLTATTDKPIQEQVDNWLADNWRAEGLVIGEKYNIYVATNNPLTTSDVTNVAALQALTYNEVTEGIAVVNTSNDNITWNGDVTSGNIYKLYDANPGSYRALTNDKKFMMDGIIENWTPDANSRDQVFGGDNSDESTNKLILNRAAAKIVLNVKFDADFLKSLTYTKKIVDGVETWVEKPDAEKVAITGSPAWKFYNFAFGAPVFAPETQGAGVEVHNSDFNIFHNQSYTGDNKSFQIVTYTYPNTWTEANYATDAPSLVISIGFTEGTGESAVTNYHYYRIPLVKSTVTAIERNHIYVINATIATRGSETTEDQDLTEDIEYAVLPWNDENNSAAIHNEVQSVQHYYFNVNPKVYTLRGDGDQSVVLNYLKATGTKVNWKLFTYDENGNQTGVVANDASGAIRAWFYNSNGVFTTAYSDTGSGIDWSNMGVTITQSNEGTSGSTGTITVTSTALTNKAIKYIRLRVYLDETNDQGQPLEETYHEDIIIRHFPTDNIQSIDGHWSSYHTANNSTTNVTLTTTILSEAQSWAEQYGVDYTASEISVTDYINYAQYTAHSSEPGYATSGATVTTRNAFLTAIQSNANRQAANSEATAIADGGEGNTYYWGTDPYTVATYIRGRDLGNYTYDYTTPNGTRYDLHRYTNYYRATYTHTYTYTEYSITVQMASTGDWVDWDNRGSHSPARTYQYSYATQNNTFRARVYEADYNAQYIYYITEQGSGNNYTTVRGDQTSLTNYHMYVIQISSTSDEYVLGRPYVNQTTHQSQDNVVSPAFMIASQLGAVTPFTGTNGPTNAATHCSRYMEVAQDGTRYTGWRLPTQAEIEVITNYQFGTIEGVTIPSAYQVLTPVLTGQWYHSLSGQEVEANPNAGSGSTTKSYLRCVRDLSAEEVERLNGFDKIQEQYR